MTTVIAACGPDVTLAGLFFHSEQGGVIPAQLVRDYEVVGVRRVHLVANGIPGLRVGRQRS